MLYPNGQRVFCYPGRHMAGPLAASGAMAYGGLLGARLNRYVSGTYSKVLGAVPSGYSGKSYVFAVKSGGLTAFSGLVVTPAATGVLGLPGTGSADFAFTVDDLIGQLISSGSGAAAMSITVANLALSGSVSGAGSSLFSITSNTPILGALAGGYGTATMTFNGQIVPYAIGSMSGNTVSGGVLSEASIASAVWSTVAASYNESGTMGAKLNSASSGGVDYPTMADAVRTELQLELLRITELAKVHGLVIGSDLVVTETSRTAGSVVQTISGDGITTTTISRA